MRKTTHTHKTHSHTVYSTHTLKVLSFSLARRYSVFGARGRQFVRDLLFASNLRVNYFGFCESRSGQAISTARGPAECESCEVDRVDGIGVDMKERTNANVQWKMQCNKPDLGTYIGGMGHVRERDGL